jgi:hypothetical protein
MPEKSARPITESASLNSSIYKVTFGAKIRAKYWFLMKYVYRTRLEWMNSKINSF